MDSIASLKIETNLYSVPHHCFVQLPCFQLLVLCACVNNYHHLKDGLTMEIAQERGGLVLVLFVGYHKACSNCRHQKHSAETWASSWFLLFCLNVFGTKF